MSRKAEGQPPGHVRVYVPDVLGNSADEDPVRVWITNPTQAQRRGFHNQVKVLLKLDKGGKPVEDINGDIMAEAMHDEAAAWKRAALTECVDRVENYTRPDVERDDSGATVLDEHGQPRVKWVPIASGSDLYHHGEPEFVEDVAIEVITAFSLTVEVKKTSETSSDSTPQTIQASDGIADSAGLMAETESVAVASPQAVSA